MTNPMNYGDFCWNELATGNVKAAKEFYGKLFGWEFHDQDVDGSVYTMIKNREKGLAGIWEIPKDQAQKIPPHWKAYVLVENVEKSLVQAKKLGAKEVCGVTKAGDFGIYAIIEDPTGAILALWQTLK